MKKILILFLLALSINAAGQTAKGRNYRNCTYTVEADGTKETQKSTIQIAWNGDNASNLDNINYIIYPSGFIIPITIPTYFDKTDKGYSIFKFTAQDEGKRQVECFITKYSESYIGFMIYYSKRLYYAFFVDLENFLYSEN